MERFELAAEGKIDPFILVIEGSIPNETNKAQGYWAGFGTDKETGQPITSCEMHRLDWPPKLGNTGRGDLRDLWRHRYDRRQSDRLYGAGRLPRLAMEIQVGNSDCLRARMSGSTGQFYGDFALSAATSGWQRANDPSGRTLCAPPGCSLPPFTKDATAAATTRKLLLPKITVPLVYREAGLLGTRRAM